MSADNEQIALAVTPAGAPRPGSGVALIAAERRRQVEAEGWSDEHDDEHLLGELALAAAAYATVTADRHDIDPRKLGGNLWPWRREQFKPGGRLRNLVRAGALIAAEIDRLGRLGPPMGETPETSPPPLPDTGPPECESLAAMLDRHCSELPQPVDLPVGRPARLAALIADWRRLRYERADNFDRNTVLHQRVAELRSEVARLEQVITGWGTSGVVPPADALAAIDPRRGREVADA